MSVRNCHYRNIEFLCGLGPLYSRKGVAKPQAPTVFTWRCLFFVFFDRGLWRRSNSFCRAPCRSGSTPAISLIVTQIPEKSYEVCRSGSTPAINPNATKNLKRAWLSAGLAGTV